MLLFPNCKINIGLNIISKRPDGYHDIATVMVPVGWHDVLEIVPAAGNETTLTVLGRGVDCPPEKNLVMKAYRALSEIAPLPPVDIYLEKIIPDGAGLGGGSADASFTLLALNEMFGLGLPKERLAKVASTLGADCTLFIYNSPMLATGTGTTLTPVDLDLSPYTIVIVKPDVKIPTREAYAQTHPELWSRPIETMLGDLIGNRPFNDFEASVFPQHPELGEIKEKLRQSGAIYASMSGSGSALFGIYADADLAQSAAEVLKTDGIVHICEAI